MGLKLNYAIKYVADMSNAVKFYRDVLGLPLKYETPEWSEFSTGETTLALHRASEKNPPGKVELGFAVPDVKGFFNEMNRHGVKFPQPPKKQEYGGMLAQFLDSEGSACSVSGPQKNGK